MQPIESYGVKILSIGFFTKPDQAVIWRGPMASKALNQLIFDSVWGDLDFLLIDLPPGTGDIHLSIIQSLPISGAVVISTPQQIALADARKGIAMFQQESVVFGERCERCYRSIKRVNGILCPSATFTDTIQH